MVTTFPTARFPVVAHRLSPPSRRTPLLSPQVTPQDVSRSASMHSHYSMLLISPWSKIDGVFPSPSSTRRTMGMSWPVTCSATESNDIATQASGADSSDITGSVGDESSSSEAKPITSDSNKSSGNKATNTSKRTPLTAREKLRAARVLARYTDTKSSKSQPASKVLDALKESDKGKKKAGLPEAPGDLFDDGNRGVSEPGWSFEFPGGSDLLIIAFSFIFISTVMFTTTYIVWKAGAIHFNEY